MAAANVLVANYETLRGQVLGSQLGGGSSPGWARLVRQGLAVWLQTVSLPTPAPLPAASATPVVALPGLQSEMANILITMVWSHYQEKPT
jgi:hypothetical protein